MEMPKINLPLEATQAQVDAETSRFLQEFIANYCEVAGTTPSQQKIFNAGVSFGLQLAKMVAQGKTAPAAAEGTSLQQS